MRARECMSIMHVPQISCACACMKTSLFISFYFYFQTMPLSNAERQRRYREKQKAKNPVTYLKKEAQRKRETYIPSNLLSPAALKKRREELCKKSKRHYKKVKRVKNDTIEVARPSSSLTMIVKLPINNINKGKQVRKTYRRSLRTAYRKNNELLGKNSELERKNKRLQKRIERLNKKKPSMTLTSTDAEDADISSLDSSINNERIPINEMTPRSKTRTEVNSLQLDRKRAAQVRKQLLLSNTVLHSIRSSVQQKKKKGVKSVWSGLMSRYRCASALSRSLGVNRKKVNDLSKERKGKAMSEQVKGVVIEFLEREDNSTTLPGKKDTKTTNKETKQKHVLSDYVMNLYEKFKLENPEIQMSRTVFYKLRPPHIILVDFANRKTCLCSKHQNLALKIKGLNNVGLRCSKNPDMLIKEFTINEEILEQINSLESTTIKFTQWKRVPDGTKMRFKEIEETVTKADFCVKFDKDLTEFRDHVDRVHTQYSQLKTLRENLPENEVLIWMDFAENFGCVSVEEVQSAYWNAAMISLHTMVVYYPTGTDNKIQSYVAASDVLSHNATAVYTILKKMIAIMKEDNPNLKRIHYLSDSPTSQYRNKTIFQFIAMHDQEFGMSARWSYLESGHGKGPCDGLGASVKRAADNAVKQGKRSIQSADDFMIWATGARESGSRVKYISYNQEDYDNSEKILSERITPVAVKGTFKIHYVIGNGITEVYTRNTSCYCKECIADISTSTCVGYTLHRLVKDSGNEGIVEALASSDQEGETGEGRNLEGVEINRHQQETVALDKLSKETWVAAMYQRKWYIGQVIDLDQNDEEVNVKFMTQAGRYGESFKWPKEDDIIWIKLEHILCVIVSPPKPSGKRIKTYTIPLDDLKKIEILAKTHA